MANPQKTPEDAFVGPGTKASILIPVGWRIRRFGGLSRLARSSTPAFGSSTVGDAGHGLSASVACFQAPAGKLTLLKPQKSSSIPRPR
ncbi:hypothetical protein [Deinococcus peraridilitoris]|uniref:hypothetical protein n=1 Tax=Deinococcus peraridilitoris TaxID=432329 RepID=UPI00030A27D7|nr:hypothetical protein [Deinococcus peraridilitoris]